MSSFFTIPSAQKKRKRTTTNNPQESRKRVATKVPSRDPKPTPRRPTRDESISGSDDESDDGPRDRAEDEEAASTSGSEGEEEETAAERRLRLAERYLDNVRQEVADDEIGFDAEQIDRDLIAERLQEDAAESKGRMYRKLADELNFQGASHSSVKWNGESVTGVATCAPWAYTVGKGLDLIKWKIQDLPYPWPSTGKNEKDNHGKGSRRKGQLPPSKKRPEQVAFVRGDKYKANAKTMFQGHVGNILCVAASQDGKFVATGGQDKRIVIWDAETLTCLKVFNQHRDAVTGLVFRRGTNQMYSSSKDRTVKIWSLDELAYVETLFGHQDEVVDIAALAQERCISVGARDRTARLWKVVEETQLVFRGGGGAERKSKSSIPKVLEGSMDRVAMIDEEHFLTGGDNGSISLWTMHKKKPIHTLQLAHGRDPALAPSEASAEAHPSADIVPQPQPRWITALATIPYSDVVLSGSWDGWVRAWKISDDKKKIEEVGCIGIGEKEVESGLARGVINDISVFERGDRGKDGVCVMLALGKEHRMGRWKKVKGMNGLMVLEVSKKGLRKNDAVNGDAGSEDGPEVDAEEKS